LAGKTGGVIVREFRESDSFPDQRCSPLAEHADVIDVMSDRLPAQVLACVNEGRQRQP
jgi:hypothetical protein